MLVAAAWGLRCLEDRLKPMARLRPGRNAWRESRHADSVAGCRRGGDLGHRPGGEDRPLPAFGGGRSPARRAPGQAAGSLSASPGTVARRRLAARRSAAPLRRRASQPRLFPSGNRSKGSSSGWSTPRRARTAGTIPRCACAAAGMTENPRGRSSCPPPAIPSRSSNTRSGAPGKARAWRASTGTTRWSLRPANRQCLAAGLPALPTPPVEPDDRGLYDRRGRARLAARPRVRAGRGPRRAGFPAAGLSAAASGCRCSWSMRAAFGRNDFFGENAYGSLDHSAAADCLDRRRGGFAFLLSDNSRRTWPPAHEAMEAGDDEKAEIYLRNLVQAARRHGRETRAGRPIRAAGPVARLSRLKPVPAPGLATPGRSGRRKARRPGPANQADDGLHRGRPGAAAAAVAENLVRGGSSDPAALYLAASNAINFAIWARRKNCWPGWSPGFSRLKPVLQRWISSSSRRAL